MPSIIITTVIIKQSSIAIISVITASKDQGKSLNTVVLTRSRSTLLHVYIRVVITHESNNYHNPWYRFYDTNEDIHNLDKWEPGLVKYELWGNSSIRWGILSPILSGREKCTAVTKDKLATIANLQVYDNSNQFGIQLFCFSPLFFIYRSPFWPQWPRWFIKCDL